LRAERNTGCRRTTMWSYVLLTLLMIVGLFLMIVILLQRGRGGGLAGAFGGLGGQGAFGTKAGDVFTVITIVTVVVWVFRACVAGWRRRVDDRAYMVGREDVDAVSVDAGASAGANKSKQDGADDAQEEKPRGDDEAGPAENKKPTDDSESPRLSGEKN